MAALLLRRLGVTAILIASIVTIVAVMLLLEIRWLQSWYPSRTVTLAHNKDPSTVVRNDSTTTTTTTTTVTITSPAAITAWCILDSNNTFRFEHFPHAAQSLFPCWSYFERMRDTHPNVACGFWYRNWTRPDEKGNNWQQPLTKVMGCKETNHTSLPVSTNVHMDMHYSHRINLTGGFAIESDNMTTTVPDIQWFDRPQDAWKLRDNVLQFYNITVDPRQRPLPRNEPLRIGFVQRPTSAKRSILNMGQIITALQKVFHTAVITNTTLEGMNLGEQAHYFASNDIIIAGHGAALTNCAFLQPGSLVVQIYPKHYSPIFFFEPLICQVKSHAYAWFAGYPNDPLQDHLLNLRNRFRNRAVNIQALVHEVVGTVVNATKDINLIMQ